MAMADAHLGTTKDTSTDAPGTATATEAAAETAPGEVAESVSADAPAEVQTDVQADTAAEVAAEPAPITLTWAEQEVVDALKRLARAQSHLADLEARADEATTPTFEAADVERLEHLQAQLTQARAKAAGRFGRAAARARLDEVEMAERLILDRMGVDSYADYRAVIESPHVEAVDPQVLAFAQRELSSARTAWLEVQALEIPPVEEPEPLPEPEVTIDLTDSARTTGGDVA